MDKTLHILNLKDLNTRYPTLEIENGKIEYTHLGMEDHGIFTFWLQCELANGGQGFMGPVMDEPVKDVDGVFQGRSGTAFGHQCIKSLLATIGVDYWEELKGKLLRIVVTESRGSIVAVGHIIKDQWFDASYIFTQMEKKEK